jgi:undecaprenyl phosphate N,N'-diacetylbacillosamine 1-phosphate transferase
MVHVYRDIVKPVADFTSSFFLLAILSPIIILTTLVLLIANKGRVFFLQSRPGLNEKTFKIIKFKTMLDVFDNEGKALPDEVRLTRVGQLVRSASLDELLQLVNVLKGDMSLVGPRPLLVQYLPLYNMEQARRHEVKPGITGWAQVNGRNTISWEEKFRLDVEYVDKQSFILDIRILWMTFLSVIKRRGINANGHVTMEEFKGPSEKINLK